MRTESRLAFTCILLAASCAPRSSEPAGESSSALNEKWTLCADEDRHCDFTGKRNVRFGVDGRYAFATFTDGADCTRAAFGSDPYPYRTKQCWYDSNDAGNCSAPTVPVEPSPTPAPGGGMHGPTIDASLIPRAEPGSAEERVQYTGEMPYKDDGGIGAFRTVCSYSHMNFDDPIVYPGQQNASHLHTFFGNTSTNFASTTASITTTGNGTCRGGTGNRTGYWVPAMIDTRSGRPLRPNESNFYYKTGYRGVRDGDVRAFPQGFRMVAGSAKSTGPQENVHYDCNGGPGQSSIPVCQPGGTLEMVVEFPQCWDGVNLDSPTHQTHIVHATPPSGCPASHPVPLPLVSFIIIYPVADGDSSTWRLSSDSYEGGAGGFSGHGDWMNGWKPELMQTFVTRVINTGLSGGSHILGDGRVIY